MGDYLTTAQIAEVFGTTVSHLAKKATGIAPDYSVGKSFLELARGAEKVRGRWRVPAETVHRLLRNLDAPDEPTVRKREKARALRLVIMTWTFGWPGYEWDITDQAFDDYRRRITGYAEMNRVPT